jgi:hypothetical protein
MELNNYFLEICETQKIYFKAQLKNIKKIHEFQIQMHNIFVKKVHIPKIIDPINYFRKNYFSFKKPFYLEARSLSNYPNAFEDEDDAIDKWWNMG